MRQQTLPFLWLMLSLALSPQVAAGALQRDRALAEALQRDGLRHVGRNVTLHADRGALDTAAAEVFLRQLDQGVEAIRAHLGPHLDEPDGGQRIEVFVSGQVRIAHVRADVPTMVYLPAARVRAGKAPYLHELVHALASWSWRHAEWLGEGLAEHVAREVEAESGGYYFSVMRAAQPERGPREHLASPEGQATLPLIGPPGRHGQLPPALQALSETVRQQRRTHAPPFYLLSTSYVDFLVAQIGIAGLRRQAVDGAVGNDRLRDAWLRTLQRPVQETSARVNASPTSSARSLP